MASEIAILAGGCFWCLDAVFRDVAGVLEVESGYTAGQIPNPNYEQVCGGKTGHAEAVRLVFNPEVISYRQLLVIFFTIHDPTTLNRQGNDIGTQYRSAIYFISPEQHDAAGKVFAELADVWDAPIVPELAPAATWYKAEDYHQDYFRHNPNQGYCAFVVAPKLAKLRKTFPQLLKRDA